MSTPIDFSAFAMNRLKLNKITRADLVGPVFNLLKGTCKSCVELEYNMEECYRALIDQLDWENPKGHRSPVDMSKPLTLYTMEGIEDMILTLWILVIIANDKDVALGISHWGPHVEKRYGYGYLKEIVVRRADQKLYKFKEGNFPNLHFNDIEDMLLLIAQNKLFNLDGDVIMDFFTALKMFTRGIIMKNWVEDVQIGVESYQRKLNLTKPQRTCQHLSAKRTVHSKLLSTRTLKSVCKFLHERLLNFKFGYNKGMPLREWTEKDKRRTCIMVNKIDDLLFKRRVLRSLEVLVGGRKTKTDKRQLEQASKVGAHGTGGSCKDGDGDTSFQQCQVHNCIPYSINKYKDMMKAQIKQSKGDNAIAFKIKKDMSMSVRRLQDHKEIDKGMLPQEIDFFDAAQEEGLGEVKGPEEPWMAESIVCEA
ncbi:hypothetical protein Tco_1401542 [Tanacetum coccineum]